MYFKNRQPGKWDLKWRPRYRIVRIEHNRHYIHIENQATGRTRSCNIKDIILEPPVKFWNIDTQFSRGSHYVNHPSNLPTIQLNDTSTLVFPSHLIPLHQYCFYSALQLRTHAFIPIMTTSQTEPGESVLFQPVLQAYPTRHSWIVTDHISLGQAGTTLEALQMATH